MIEILWQTWLYTFVLTISYVYIKSFITHFIEEQNIYQPNKINIIITIPGVLGKWSYNSFELLYFTNHFFLHIFYI